MSVKVRYSSEYLSHSGIKGQKWGVRRYQNPDGSLTPEGRKRYYKDNGEYTLYAKIKNSKHAKRDIRFAKKVMQSESDEIRGYQQLRRSGKDKRALSKSDESFKYSKDVLTKWGKVPDLDDQGLVKKRRLGRVNRAEQEIGRAAYSYRSAYSKLNNKPDHTGDSKRSTGKIGLTDKELAAEKAWRLSVEKNKNRKNKRAYKQARKELRKAIADEDYQKLRKFGSSLSKATKDELSDTRKHTKELIREIKNYPHATKQQKRKLIKRGVAKSVETLLYSTIPIPVVSGYVGEHAGNIVRRMK